MNNNNFEGKKREINIKKEEKFTTRCFFCKREAEMTLKPFGDGYIGTCSLCGEYGYNGKEKPPRN